MIKKLLNPKYLAIALSSTVAILNLWSKPVWAGDPFRANHTRTISDRTEAAFNALFEEGNYPQAKNYLIEAESNPENEPLAHAMRASLAYTEKDWETLKNYAHKTLDAAKSLKNQDPLRGNLYLAVGTFLEGAYTFEKEGALGAITKLQQVFQYLDEAEKVDAADPELNLIKGYMDLILAVNLPFSNPDQAIERLEDYGSPDYLVARGIAIAYRDLKQYDQALKFVDRALSSTPDNPEIYYLKGQILYQQGKQNQDQNLFRQSLENFDKALAKSNQLPESVVKTLERERRNAQKKLDEVS
jgi:tetratricopeptide (TPR) repeat protein